MKKIPLTQGKVALVDDADYGRLICFNWCVNGRGYAETWMKTRTVRMHRFIIGCDDLHKVVDHIDGNPLNNQKKNLRICNVQQNTRNSKVHRDNPTGYKGVSWDKSRNKFESCIRVNKKKKHLGRFECAIDAAKAYNEAALKYYGEYSKLNVLEES